MHHDNSREGPAPVESHATDTPAGQPNDDSEFDPGDPVRPRQADVLVKLALAAGVELFHTPAREAHGGVPRGDHKSWMKLADASFVEWLQLIYYRRYGRSVSMQAVREATATLTSKAIFDGPTKPVHLRVADHAGSIVLDLGDQDGHAVRISPDGWEVVKNSPVRFYRPPSLAPLPIPQRGGSVTELREFINVTDQDWPLVAGWMVAALRPTGPYPVLMWVGEQGTAKSTATRVVQNLIDPNRAPLRALPGSVRDLMIAANNGWVLTWDNLSSVRTDLADALCRVSTGGSFGTRTNYTDLNETLINAQRPMILTGINELTNRGTCSTVVCSYTPQPLLTGLGDRRRSSGSLTSTRAPACSGPCWMQSPLL